MAILAKGTPAALFILLKWPFSRPPGRPHFVNRRSNRKVKMGLKWYEQGNFERPYRHTAAYCVPIPRVAGISWVNPVAGVSSFA
jgi:hypothetical protein